MTGIDVSKWQGMIQWSTVKPGIDFVMIRAGSGTNKDVYALTNAKQCEALGIEYGFYWYSYARDDMEARREADLLVSFCKENKLTPSYPLAYDFEYDSMENVKKAGKPFNTQYLCSMATAFCQRLEENGFYAMIYCNRDFYQNHYGAEIFKRFDLWYAHWDIKEPQVKYGIWQYSCKGGIKGITGGVDLNKTNKDYPKIIKNKKLNGW